MEALDGWDRDRLNELFAALAESMDLKIRDVLAPIFVAVSGKPVSPPLFDSMAIIGPDLIRARIKHGTDVLGGISNKALKKLQKEYEALSRT